MTNFVLEEIIISQIVKQEAIKALLISLEARLRCASEFKYNDNLNMECYLLKAQINALKNEI